MRGLKKRPAAMADRAEEGTGSEPKPASSEGGSPFAVRAGLKLVSADAGRATATLHVRRDSHGEGARVNSDAVSGLVQASAAATATGSEGRSELSDVYITFVRPTPQHPLTAEARVVGLEGPFQSCEVEVRDWNGDLVAKAFLRYRL
jgi:acyl-coenzyme A thioesterase PaaI-like protein